MKRIIYWLQRKKRIEKKKCSQCCLTCRFGKSKTQDVRLTEKEIRELKKNMSRSELKEFEKRQKQAERDRFWDAVCMAELLDD